MNMDPVVHFEIPGDDRDRMIAFYSKAFGWKTEKMGKEMGEYVVVTTTDKPTNAGGPMMPGSINGGFYLRSKDHNSQYPSVVIAVENLEESLKKVKAAGGTQHGDAENIPGVGKFASIIDTEGNRLSILQPLRQ